MVTPTALVLGTMGTPMPDGYVAVPWPDGMPAPPSARPPASLTVGSGVGDRRAQPGPSSSQPDASMAGGPLVVLRDLLDARVLLGCFIDTAQSVHRWVEVWVQDIGGLAKALPTYRETLTNSKLDEHWAAHQRHARSGAGGLGDASTRARSCWTPSR